MSTTRFPYALWDLMYQSIPSYFGRYITQFKTLMVNCPPCHTQYMRAIAGGSCMSLGSRYGRACLLTSGVRQASASSNSTPRWHLIRTTRDTGAWMARRALFAIVWRPPRSSNRRQPSTKFSSRLTSDSPRLEPDDSPSTRCAMSAGPSQRCHRGASEGSPSLEARDAALRAGHRYVLCV